MVASQQNRRLSANRAAVANDSLPVGLTVLWPEVPDLTDLSQILWVREVRHVGIEVADE